MNRTNKIVFIQVKLLEGWNDKQIRQYLGIPERTYFYWKRIIMTQGHSVLINKKKPGPKPSFEVNDRTVEKILNLRRKYGWGPTKIEGHFRVHPMDGIIPLPHNRIHKILVENKLNRPVREPRKTWGKKRWERLHSMSLCQCDWKDINCDDERPMLTFYDDHSRFVLASRRFEEATMDNTIKLAGYAFKRHGVPEQMLTDNGSQFVNNRSDELTEFELFCKNKGIETIRSTKNRPTTLGKIENFHGCYDSEIWVTNGNHKKFVHYWNNKRPNGAIGYLYPVEVFYRDRKTAINSG